MYIKEVVRKAAVRLKKNNVAEPEKSAEFLMRYLLKKDKAWLIVNYDKEIDANLIKKFNQLIGRRLKHEPLWYITGKIEFFGLDLCVTEDVLIPRPETEFLVEKAISEIEKIKKGKVLDIGTGSGAIALSLADFAKKENLNIKVCASDISKKAPDIAKKNAKKLKISDWIEFREGHLLEPWKGEKFNIVTANLPYIPHEDIPTLSPDIHHWEPRVSLDGGKGGTELYSEFIRKLPKFLKKDYRVLMEIGYDQGEKIEKEIKESFPKSKIIIENDYSDKSRFAFIF